MWNIVCTFRRVAILILFLSFSSFSHSQTTLYQQDFESLSQGPLEQNASYQDGWRVTGISYGLLNYNHNFGIHNGGQAISGKSLGVSLYADIDYLFDLFGYQYTSCAYDTKFDLAAYRAVSTLGYEEIILQFDWKGMGEFFDGNWVDYGNVGYSLTGGAPFTWMSTGGKNGDGLYHSQKNPGTITISFPAEVANHPDFTLAFRSVADKCRGNAPQFIVDNIILRGNPITTDRILTVNNSGNGATYGDGTHSISNNTEITVTSGEREGYLVTGWIGTGSAPSEGAGAEVTFTILENSQITWYWEEKLPKDVHFHDFGGNEQLTFNYSQTNSTMPVFRLSHSYDLANEYEIEINSASDFSGNSWAKNFSGTYPENTENNFEFTEGFTPESGNTYYVRARARGMTNELWSNWSTANYNFTYHSDMNLNEWFQTTQSQFKNNQFILANATSSGDVAVIAAEGEVIVNGSFENGLNNWFKESNFETNYSTTVINEGATHGTNALQMWNNSASTRGYLTGDYVSMNQIIDLTGISRLMMDASYLGTGSLNVQLRVYIAEVAIFDGWEGVLVHTWSPPSNISGAAIDIDLSSYNFTGNKLLKIMYYVNGEVLGTRNIKYLNVDHVRTIPASNGTVTSVPIHLASVYESTRYGGVSWNQSLNGGEFKLKIQQFDGESWWDVPGYDSFSFAEDGEHTLDLSEMEPLATIRLVGELIGTDTLLHDWKVMFNSDECATETIWNGNAWSNGIPVGSTVKMIFEADFTADETNTLNNGLVGCALEIKAGAEVWISSGYHVILDNEVLVDDENGASLTIDSDANLLQNNPVENIGKITVRRKATVPSVQYNFWASPVKDQLLYELYQYIPNNRVMIYNTATDYFNALPKSGNPQSQFGIGYSIKGPSTNPDAPEVTAEFFGIPQNESVDQEENRIPLSSVGNGYNLIGNPYPSNLNLKLVFQENENQFFNDETEDTPAFYFWDNTDNETTTQQGSGYEGNNYAIYNPFSGGVAASGGDGMKKPNGIVKPGQGFIIRASETATELIVGNRMRTIDTKLTEDGDEAVYYKGSNLTGSRKREGKFYLELVNPKGMQVQLAIGYFEQADNGFEKYDSPIFNEAVSDNLYSLSKDDRKLAIQGRKAPFRSNDIVPLGVKLFQYGKYKIQLEDHLGVFETQQTIYLRDKYENQIHNLSESAYEWSGEPGEFVDRFEIIYQETNPVKADLTDTKQNQINIWKQDPFIFVKSNLHKIKSVEIFTLSGKSIYQNESVNSREISIPVKEFGKQILFLKVQTETGEIQTKKLIN